MRDNETNERACALISIIYFSLNQNQVFEPSDALVGSTLKPYSTLSNYDGTHSDAVDAESDFEPFDDATNYYGEQDCADAFDDAGLSARYFDQE